MAVVGGRLQGACVVWGSLGSGRVAVLGGRDKAVVDTCGWCCVVWDSLPALAKAEGGWVGGWLPCGGA